MSKKIRPNRYRPEDSDSGGATIDFCVKCIMIVAAISIVSLASIFMYDFITQSTFFKIKKIEISGTKQILREDLLKLADLTPNENIFKINLFSIKKRIESHPWVQSADIKRKFSSILSITVVEQEPLAIIRIENLADILINTQGTPFKEYNPQDDRIENLPVISGLDLTIDHNQYMFDGPLFNAIMDFLKTENLSDVKQIKGNKNTGITIVAKDIYNKLPPKDPGNLQIKLGFNHFTEKLNKAIKISEYIDKNFPQRTICTMDLFNIKKVFIKTKLNTALHNNLEKGV